MKRRPTSCHQFVQQGCRGFPVATGPRVLRRFPLPSRLYGVAGERWDDGTAHQSLMWREEQQIEENCFLFHVNGALVVWVLGKSVKIRNNTQQQQQQQRSFKAEIFI